MKFPVLEAFLVQPNEGKEGKIGICTNTIAPTQVINEIPINNRKDVIVLGSLVVSRDGTERMIINCLAHPNIEYLILFGEETLSFRPSSNLLLALMNGYDEEKNGNVIINGKGIAHQYPSISKTLLDKFRKKVKVIPLFTGLNSNEIVKEYLNFKDNNLSDDIIKLIRDIRSKKKIYFDSLNLFIEKLSKLPNKPIEIELDLDEFAHLCPPIISINEEVEKRIVPFRVDEENGLISANICLNGKCKKFVGEDSFLIAYTIMKNLECKLMPIEALLLGAELSRVEMQIKTGDKFSLFSVPNCGQKGELVELEKRTILKADKKFYYKILLKENKICVQSLTHDTCEKVFELQSKKLLPILEKIAKENRFEEYEQKYLHMFDVGIETARAAIALNENKSFFQDFRNIFAINKDKLSMHIIEGDSFLKVHQGIITNLYTEGLTISHPDEHKGTMRSGTVLAVFRKNSLNHLPAMYQTGKISTTQMREEYKQQLLSKEAIGTYTYGSRTRSHFGFDQLEKAAQCLKENKYYVIQRFDYLDDMTVKMEDGRLKSSKDPCLTHDIYFVSGGRLHSFHIARAHNIINAYPENIFGLHDAYDRFIAQRIGIELGDMCMLSSRANILLLTEEQKAKRIINEPAKPSQEVDVSIGPYKISNEKFLGIGYKSLDLIERNSTNHESLKNLENYFGENIIYKAIRYLKLKGVKHNNPIIGEFYPGKQIGRLVFFQCNDRGGKLNSTAVFLSYNKEDENLCHYLSTIYKNELGIKLGRLNIFWIK